MGTNQRKQIAMSEDEVATFIEQGRTATMATIGPAGRPHLVAMWYAVIDGQIWFETKAKSQKVQNLRRDNRLTCMIEAGFTYDALRGVSLEGYGVIIEEPEAMWKVGVSVWERYTGPYSESVKPMVEAMMNKRIVVRLDSLRVRSWDHRKLGMAAAPLSGSTAQDLRTAIDGV